MSLLGHQWSGDIRKSRVALFLSLRPVDLDLRSRLTPADLERAGVHNERGLEALGLLRRYAGHDLAHLARIARCIQAVPA